MADMLLFGRLRQLSYHGKLNAGALFAALFARFAPTQAANKLAKL